MTKPVSVKAGMEGDKPRVEHLRAVLEPGEDCSYSELIGRFNQRNLPTAGIGMFIEQFGYEPAAHRQEFVTWMRDRIWDDEVAGGWIEVSLWIARRPDA